MLFRAEIPEVPQRALQNATEANGECLSTGVQPAACHIPSTHPGGCLFSPVVPGGNQISPDRASPAASVGWGDIGDDQDASVFVSATTGNKVWDDLNGNGSQDEGEPSMANVQVDLVDSDSGSIVAMTTTDGQGGYWFAGVSPGECSAHFAVPSGYEFPRPLPNPCPSDLMPLSTIRTLPRMSS